VTCNASSDAMTSEGLEFLAEFTRAKEIAEIDCYYGAVTPISGLHLV